MGDYTGSPGAAGKGSDTDADRIYPSPPGGCNPRRLSLVEHLQRVQQTPVRNKKILSKVHFLALL